MKNKKDVDNGLFSNDGLGTGLKEFIHREANAFVEKNGFSSYKGMAQWLAAEISSRLGGFIAKSNVNGMDPDLQANREMVKSYLQSLDMSKVALGERQPIDKEAVIAKHLDQVIKNSPIYFNDPTIVEARSLEDVGLSQDGGLKTDENGNYIITLDENYHPQGINETTHAPTNNLSYSSVVSEQSKGEVSTMGEDLKKYEQMYKDNVLAFKSDLDLFFKENSNKLKEEAGKNELVEELMTHPLRRIENAQERKAFAMCFVDDYAKNLQDNPNSFTRTGCELIAAKYTKTQIEKDANLHAYENGKISQDYAEFAKNNSDRAKANDQNLIQNINSQGRDPNFKEVTTHRANQQIQKNWDVGSYQSKNMSQGQSSTQTTKTEEKEENNIRR